MRLQYNFNYAKRSPQGIWRESDVTRLRPRVGGLPHLETFSWQNLTPTEIVTRFGSPGNPAGRVTPPIM